METKSHWGLTPRQSVEQECARRGERAVVSGCISLLRGRVVDGQLILALGGPPAAWVRTGGEPGPAYWLRVWAARGLPYAWHGSARGAVRAALEDEAWRVREMAVRVVAERGLRKEQAIVEAMCEDESARVRAAATKALKRLGD
jgi:HEAT repeat protein